MSAMNTEVRMNVADALIVADAARSPLTPLSETWGALSTDDAYQVQLLNVVKWLGAGRRLRGYRIGMADGALVFGHLMEDMLVDDGAALPFERYCAPRAAPAMAFVLGRPLAGPGCTVLDVLRAIELVAPALEIVDSRIDGWRGSAQDVIADNASAAGVVLGGQAGDVRRRDRGVTGIVVRRNGEVAAMAATGSALRQPARSVAWLANELAGHDRALEPGQVIVSSSSMPAIEVAAGDTIRSDFEDLGSVSATWVASAPDADVPA